jgi:hypothetical protein
MFLLSCPPEETRPHLQLAEGYEVFLPFTTRLGTTKTKLGALTCTSPILACLRTSAYSFA